MYISTKLKRTVFNHLYYYDSCPFSRNCFRCYLCDSLHQSFKLVPQEFVFCLPSALT